MTSLALNARQCIWMELERQQRPARHRYPVAIGWHEMAMNVASPGALLDLLELHGIGRGSLMPPHAFEHYVFFPPGWRGPAWSPELDVRWRALEVLAAYSDRKARLARERMARSRPLRGRRLPRTLITDGALRGAA